jgi:beta-glucosidase
MKKIIKVSLITLLSLLLLLAILGFAGWSFVNSNFLDFESDYKEAHELTSITEGGYTFLDRNNNGSLDIYEDDRKPRGARVQDALAQMTIEEKIHLLKGSGIASAMGRLEPGEGIPGVVGTIVATPRLGLPAINLSDGPAGLRILPEREGQDRTFYCTAFPIGTLISSTWNKQLAFDIGNAMGHEAKEYGIDVILGPAVNIHRHPFCGRNFEYFSEDPVLTGRIGASIVSGIESNGVGTSVKHFVANNQETNRTKNSSEVSERALREIYLKSFEIIVKEAQPWTIMSSYNKVNGKYVAEDKRLLTEVLRGDWAYEGLVMSDWFAGNSAAAMVAAGNDLLEPGTNRQWKALTEAHEDGSLTEDEINIAAGRILDLIFKSKKIANYAYGEQPDLEANARIARQAAAEGTVLLTNNGTLPLKSVKKVALLGATSYDFISGGTGSGDVNEAYTISLEQGLQNTGFEVSALGRSYFDDHKALNAEKYVKTEGLASMMSPYDPPEITYTDEQLNALAAESDIAVLTIGRNSGEGGDRLEIDDFLLTAQEQDMINRASAIFHDLDKKLVVVLNIGGVIETASWIDAADAVVLAWQGGQESGNAVADVLSGAVNPSGRLPMTFPLKLDDHASNANFPQVATTYNPIMLMLDKKEKPRAEWEINVDYTLYEEGIYVGYRHFDKANLEVSFPFGYGLSYTEFEYLEPTLELKEDSIGLKLRVKNTGLYPGKEVIQLYTSNLSAEADHPEKELRAFSKTKLIAPGAEELVQIWIPKSDLSYWDETAAVWKLSPSSYGIKVGNSSRAIFFTKEIVVE